MPGIFDNMGIGVQNNVIKSSLNSRINVRNHIFCFKEKGLRLPKSDKKIGISGISR